MGDEVVEGLNPLPENVDGMAEDLLVT